MIMTRHEHRRAPEAGFRPLPAPRWGRGRHPTGEARGEGSGRGLGAWRSLRRTLSLLARGVTKSREGMQALYLDLPPPCRQPAAAEAAPEPLIYRVVVPLRCRSSITSSAYNMLSALMVLETVGCTASITVDKFLSHSRVWGLGVLELSFALMRMSAPGMGVTSVGKPSSAWFSFIQLRVASYSCRPPEQSEPTPPGISRPRHPVLPQA